ncbi:HVO_2072 family ArtA-dependent S-layer glycoprotein [Halorubrum rutilum]|uniref:HVO_2072 family ArtA-dependent S-layer glycoprotein n=1 Tax=Halorubrum rutilum TaxID=1364933 RepID=A0ABD6AIA2_9EURY|nr:HVO_2072 family ArtA-dependent S-layer glycoprotein [Halorubrum rutilum]
MTVTTQVTVDNGSANFGLSETFSPDFQDASIDSIQVDGSAVSPTDLTGQGADGTGATVGLSSSALSDGSTVTVEYTVTALNQTNATHTISGTATNGPNSETSVGGETEFTTTDGSGDGGDGSDGSDGSDGGDGAIENRDVADETDAEIDGVSEGDVLVTSGNTVYQGEEGITFIDPATNEVYSASQLSGTSGNREGTPLQMPIPENEDTGTYDLNGPESGDGGFSTTVVEPRITTSEVRLNGDDIDQVASSRSGDLEIFAEWNFDDAEGLEVSVEDPSGSEITGEVVQGSDVLTESGTGVELDLSTEDAGEYTVTFEGNDDLDQDDVVQEYTIETTSQDSVSIDVAEDSVTQGDNVEYTVSGGTNNDFHTVTIDANDFRDDIDEDTAEDIFRNVEDVQDTGVVSDNGDFDYAYATVEIDGTTGVGSINTGALDDSSVEVEVYEATDASTPDVDGLESLDDVSFDVEEGEIVLDSPTGTYTIGSEADINGTAASADEVAIYARDNNEWELLDVNDDGELDEDDFISVDSDDSFEEEDVNLRSASNILAFEGNYGIGAVDVADLPDDADEFDQLSNSDFSSASSTRETITAQSGDLSANFATINGQIADEVDEDIDVNGTATGQDTIVVAFVGERGDTYAQEITVDNDDTFEEEDISLVDISQGAVSGHVISPSRDGQFGDGGDWGTASEVVNEIQGLGQGSSTGDQIRSQILANTVDETGSDDLIVSTTFRINDPTLSVNNVYPEAAEASGLNPVATGETVVVEGDTNRQPDNAAITVELLTQDENSIQSVSTDTWGSNGQWSVTMDTSDVETGTYIIEADDGESTDRVNVEIVEERQTDDGEDGADDGEDGADDGADDGEDGADDGADDGEDGADDGADGDDGADNGTDDGGDGGTDDSTPGFGALVALVALIAAALLATRRDN